MDGSKTKRSYTSIAQIDLNLGNRRSLTPLSTSSSSLSSSTVATTASTPSSAAASNHSLPQPGPNETSSITNLPQSSPPESSSPHQSSHVVGHNHVSRIISSVTSHNNRQSGGQSHRSVHESNQPGQQNVRK